MTDVKPFVKPGEQLNYTKRLKERGLWPARLHKPDDNGNHREKVTTPFIVIPATPADMGLRPLPNSTAFHSKGIWLQDMMGAVVTTPVVGGKYIIKCRIRNNGAVPAYGGLADFFVNKPSAFAAAAGTTTSLPALGHTGFFIKQGEEKVISCPKPWQPASAAELTHAIVVHAFDPFTDNITKRYDAKNDRHVGRHDNSADLYVRDWTDSAMVHDNGTEPSVNPVFYRTSDVWNRRSDTPGTFVNDKPENQNPQAGNGAAGDNFMYARISRNSAATEQTVKAHFLFSEFGTGSPYVNCSAAPDPSVTLAVGEASKIISLPWHLHPSSSPHLCIAVQIYSADDPYMPPGLLGYTPGWPTTDMMVINDNNKAQRNISVWNGVPETPGMYFSIIYNAATFIRDVNLQLDASPTAGQKLKNAKLIVPSTRAVQEFKPGGIFTLKAMQPGERRWIAFSFDSFSVSANETISVNFNELEGRNILNGFALDIKAASAMDVMMENLSFQSAVFYRMSEGLGSRTAKEGLVRIQRLLEQNRDVNNFIRTLPLIVNLINIGFSEVSQSFGGIKDVVGIFESTRKLLALGNSQNMGAVLAQHNIVLQQLDALLTMAVKSRGDVADILFTVRLQRDVYKKEKLRSTQLFEELLKAADAFINNYSADSASPNVYMPFVRSLLPSFERTNTMFNNRIIAQRFGELVQGLGSTPEALQKAHLNYLNALLILLS
jgi:hypothetical protein